jgi:glycosyltransferase involved in cell wall biosynthesis
MLFDASNQRASKSTMTLRVAYLINQYPKVSHSFIRREILALEQLGVEVQRFALRGWADELVDPADVAERERTRYVLQRGVKFLMWALARQLFTAPIGFGRALSLAIRMAARSEKSLPYHLIYLAEACALMGWLNGKSAEHVHAHFGTNPAEVATLLHALGGPPFSFTVHGPEEFDKPEAIALGEKIRRSAFVVAISSYGRSQLYRWSRSQDWARVKVVHCGLDAGFHSGTLPPITNEPQLVCVGRLCEQKGQLLLVHAAHLLVREGIPLQLVLAGDGEMRGEIEALIAQLGLGAHVRITGWVDAASVRSEILAARALVLPSFAEGLPVVLMEALALARPVLSTYVAGIPELVRSGEAGWLFPAGDVESLASAMRECLAAQPADLDKMGAAGRSRVLERHSVDIEAAKLMEHFRAASQNHQEVPA